MPAGPRKSGFLYTNFLPNFPPISIPFSKKKHAILTKLGAFYNNLPKTHPIYVIWAPSSLMKTPDRYTKFDEKVPQKAGTYTYTCQCENPPTLGATLCQPLSTAFTSHYKVMDDTLKSSLADTVRCNSTGRLDLNCHSVQMPAHSPLSTHAAVASSGTCHCYPEWHNFPVYQYKGSFKFG